ncbi:MAG: DNA-3-methyladenine glycosylase [Acidobacteria bacterium]|nr:DNA-3-methyladenine glycosylase [Acidobacteriota bacterium]
MGLRDATWRETEIFLAHEHGQGQRGCRGEDVMRATVLPRAFYARPTLKAAHDLIGKVVVHVTAAGTAAGMIVEVEAYAGEDDPACHAAAGLTGRNAPLYGAPGRAYVYLNYGLHHLLNAVTEPAGSPGAVLIRALEPRDGFALMRRRRTRGARAEAPPPGDDALCRGPGNLTAALGITLAQNGTPLGGGTLYIEDRGERTAPPVWTPRIGIRVGVERRWRCHVPGCPSVSGRR